MATGLGNRVIHTLAISPDGLTIYAGTGSGTVFEFVRSNSVPGAFAFTDQTNVALSTATESNAITASGINVAASISVGGAVGSEYQIGSGGWTSVTGTVSNGQTVKVRHTSSASYSTTIDTTLTIGGVSDTFSTTTLAAPAPVPGVCGSAAGQSWSSAPAQNLCAPGTASTLTSADGQYRWTCAGLNNGASSPTCIASWTTSGNGSGTITLPPPQSNNQWSLASASFFPVTGHASSPAVAPPTNHNFSHGLAGIVLSGGIHGSSAQIALNFTEAVPEGAVYMKYGKSPQGYSCTGAACNQDHWYEFPREQVQYTNSRKTLSLTIQDGGVGDSDNVPGQITDPGGPVQISAIATSIPALSQWGIIILSSLLLLGTWLITQREKIQIER